MDIGAGHIWSNGFTLGLLYGTEKIESGGASLDRKAYGPTVGWVTSQSNGNGNSTVGQIFSVGELTIATVSGQKIFVFRLC